MQDMNPPVFLLIHLMSNLYVVAAIYVNVLFVY